MNVGWMLNLILQITQKEWKKKNHREDFIHIIFLCPLFPQFYYSLHLGSSLLRLPLSFFHYIKKMSQENENLCTTGCVASVLKIAWYLVGKVPTLCCHTATTKCWCNVNCGISSIVIIIIWKQGIQFRKKEVFSPLLRNFIFWCVVYHFSLQQRFRHHPYYNRPGKKPAVASFLNSACVRYSCGVRKGKRDKNTEERRWK